MSHCTGLMMRRRYKLHGHKWARVRRAALVRDNFQCVKCGRAGRMEVDHVLQGTKAARFTTWATFKPFAISATLPRHHPSLRRYRTGPDTARNGGP